MANRILVVDDEPDVVGFLSRLLADNGYETFSAESGNAALERIKQDKPDLILLDLQMASGTGTDFYRQLRNKRELQDIPVIVVSGLAGRRIAVGKEVPVIDKPVDEAALLELVRKTFAG